MQKPGGALYVQYGCGRCAPEQWINFDASPRLRLERLPLVGGVIASSIGRLFAPNVRYGDISTGLPVPPDSAAGVYCSHVLEHLPRDGISTALLNTNKILMPGGLFRLVVPDLHWRVLEYLEAARNADSHAADRFFDRCMMGTRAKSNGLIAAARRYCGLSAHQWMYDFAALKLLLEAAGFVDVRRCELGDSGDAMFALVEERDRFFEGEQPELAMEARKPA
jgi:SAM-dependent methyltransferase